MPRAQGEAIRRALIDEGALDVTRKVRLVGDHLLLPLIDTQARHGHEVVMADLQKIGPKHVDYRDLLPADLSDAEREALPTSFDVIGHVLIIKIPAALQAREAAIAAALLEATPRVETVAHDDGVQGELRTRALRILAGEPTTLTTHTEYGVRILVDPATCYFSPRLATERYRVAKLVADGEIIVDLMAGVAPFALVIARHAKPAHIDAVDLNAAAIALAHRNVAINKMADIIHCEAADARVWVAAHEGMADRVITNLPHSAHAFLEAALSVLKPTGGVWHYHGIHAPEDLGRHLAELAERAARIGRTIEVKGTRIVRAFSPRENHYAVDFDVR